MSHEHHDWREEIWNALTHGAGVLLSLIGGAVLITLVAIKGDGRQLAGALVFCLTLVTLYTSSTLYHAIPHQHAKRRLKVFDHCAIFLLIAGTYTPFTLIALRDRGGWWLFALVWTLAALGIVFKLFFTGRFKGVSTLIYLAMGWLMLVAIKPFMEVVPHETLYWLFGGGLAYTLGTVFYMSKRNYSHAVWHGFVLVGSACHFVAVALHVLGTAPASTVA